MSKGGIIRNRVTLQGFTTKGSRPGIEKCDKCGHIFSRKDQFFLAEHQWTCFRGDDDVYAFCYPCMNKIQGKEWEETIENVKQVILEHLRKTHPDEDYPTWESLVKEVRR